MIQSLSRKYRSHIAWPLFVIFYIQLIFPYAVNGENTTTYHREDISSSLPDINAVSRHDLERQDYKNSFAKKRIPANSSTVMLSAGQSDAGGPTSPEATSFKAVGSDNLVNLFTGDFSYSIPLLDVGGYPVNLFYNGGIMMEQEPSWVGLGWNINPGTVSRNMRGVPDDFDGTDTLTQTQNVKPNKTWGGEVGVDGEILGIKKPNFNLSLGFSYNNYLGPELDAGAGVSIPIASLKVFQSEKSALDTLGLSLGLNAKLSSRSGLTLSPSLNASLPLVDKTMNAGVGLTTSYNSRTGIKDLTLYSEMSFFYSEKKGEGKDATFSAYGSFSEGITSSTISFSKPSYMPVLRMPMENSNYSGQLELGGGIFGFRGAVTGNGYYTESRIPSEWQVVKKPLVGYLYSENANENKNAVMDFNRVNDAEVTPNTPVISAPEYTYDIFSIQGEGTGGTIRAYRGDIGFMRDNETTSKDNSSSIGFDIAPPGHYGGNWNSVSSPTKVGGWEDANNTLSQTLVFKSPQANTTFENVYFRNPGEVTVSSDDILDRIGRDNLVSFQLSGSKVNPRLESTLQEFNKHTLSNIGTVPIAVSNNLQNREKRTQVTTMLTAEEATAVGLEKKIRNYTGSFDTNNNIEYDSISRVGGFRKKNHISEIDVLEQNGMRYVYGIPVYNVIQKDFTFSVENLQDTSNNIVDYTADEPTIASHDLNDNSHIDGYVQIQQTPAYASSFLLTGLLSPDYVDVTGNGITEDDLGNAVKFNYTKSDSLHKWRTPRMNNSSHPRSAHFNEGLKTEKKDNKAAITYGEREAWYLSSIESKSMIAIFKTDERDDAKGVLSDMDGRVNGSENVNRKLSRIDLYTKAEIKAKGIDAARPIKSVFFVYDYSLCNGTPDNLSGGGKLTLKSVYFTYNGQDRRSKDKYVFNYGDSSSDNPAYTYSASDKWGTYKDPSVNPFGLTNIDYPYTSQNKTEDDQYAGAWSLKKILLPSGSQMEMQYEADDYAYTQDRRSCNMFSVYGLGNSTAYASSNRLYNDRFSPDNYYVYVHLANSLESTNSGDLKKEIYSKYLEGINQLAFKLQVQMPLGAEPLTVYAEFDDYGVCSNSSGNDYIYIHLKSVDGKSPLATSAIGFLTDNIPDQAFPGYEMEINGLKDFIDLAGVMLTTLTTAFKNVNDQMRDAGNARTIALNKSFIRLDNPQKIKYGGGVRVKRITVKDNWNKMTGQYDSEYGQDYDYTTVEKINGKDETISSGVASYEPGIGSEENPFREIILFKNKLPAASAHYGAIETPILESMYPSPNVGYSKVTVRSIHRKGTHGDSSLRSAIGKQVTEFYTARDYPSYSSYTPMNSMDYHKAPLLSFFYKELIDRRTISQGFLVETNDMHGKMKSQAAFSESDENTPLSASYYKYSNTGKNGLNDQVNFVYNKEGGTVRKGNMGIDVELMTDVREFKVQSDGLNIQGQVDLFPILFPFFIPTLYPLNTYIENKYRAVTCTKLINYHAILDSTIVMDKGSTISTKTLAYDAETGLLIVTSTSNEFNDPIYNISYPAYWAYSGTGPAYQNTGMQFKNVNFYDGKITTGADTTMFESGDELYINIPGSGTSGCISESANVTKLWAFDKNKDTTALTVPAKNLVFMDSVGRRYTKEGVGFKIIRSGKRNNLGLTVSSVTCMKNPIRDSTLVVDNSDNVVTASSVEYKEKWQTDGDVILRKTYYYPSCSSPESDSTDCNGILEKNINPYIKGLFGNYKVYRSLVCYGSRKDSDVTVPTAIRKNGYIQNFNNYWIFNDDDNLVRNYSKPQWVWNSEVTKVNAKGQELETRDALNRYTMAQFGFNKNFPVATTQNARFGAAFDDGFEDYGYQESLNNNSQVECNNCQYVNFSGLSNCQIINTSDSAVKAHTGKMDLSVSPNSSVTKSLSVNSAYLDSFSLITKTDTTKHLNELGGNIISSYESVPSACSELNPDAGFLVYTTFSNNANFMILQVDYGVNNCYNTSSPWSYNKWIQQFIEIQSDGNYTINSEYYQNADVPEYHLPDMTTHIYSVSTGNEVLQTEESRDTVSNMVTVASSACLKKGIYKIVSICSNYQFNHCSGTCYNANSHDVFQLSIEDFTGYSYKSISTSDGCVSSEPIPATDSMLNPIFLLVPGKRMQFSAWVREKCGTPCFKSSYDSSTVKLQFPGSGSADIILKPSGNIIEGWQKLEGEFTVPSNATTTNLILTNITHSNIYFDDIRIHPFNANMKSYVYDARTLRLSAELDENNYATFYEYDEEGQLVRVKKETVRGVETIQETRSAKQKSITDVQ